MNTLIFLILTSFYSVNVKPNQLTSDLTDQANVEDAVTLWASTNFIYHEGEKFEQFRPFYTDEYSIQQLRIEAYTEKIDLVKTKKLNGSYTGTEDDYAKEIKKLEDALSYAKQLILQVQRIDYYEIHYWTNIQTVDGITVYYELILKLDQNYTILEALENSSIGKKSAASKIAYKPATELIKVIEK
jgi:hypothetical protein